jgi:hypothetical protein
MSGPSIHNADATPRTATNARSNDGLTAFFVHIPKTAGSTLATIIRKQYSGDALFDLGRAHAQAMQDSIERFRQFDGIENVRCVMGHAPYGLHQWFPGNFTYITMLRNPVHRELSHYYFILKTPHHHQHERLVRSKTSLEDFVHMQSETGFNNMQTRFVVAGDVAPDCWNNLAGPHPPLPPDAVEIAKLNIRERFAVAGTVEHFDASLLLFQQALGWGSVYYARENVTPSSRARDSVSKESIRLIEKHNEMDVELYRFAQGRLTEQICEGGDAFAEKLERFRRMNRAYGTAHRARAYLQHVRGKIRLRTRLRGLLAR